MDKAIQHKIKQVRIRLSLNRLFELLIYGLFCIEGLWLILLCAERFLVLPILTKEVVGGGILVIGIVVGVIWFGRIPTLLQTSVLIDEKLALKSRLSSFLVLNLSKDRFAQATCDEVTTYMQSQQPIQHFPWLFSRSWIYGALILVVLGILQVSLPIYPLWSFQEDPIVVAEKPSVEVTQAKIQENTRVVKKVVERLEDPALEEALAGLDAFEASDTPEAAKRQAIRKLGDMSDRIKQSMSNPTQQAMQQLQKALKQLRPPPGELARNLQLALARGKFTEAGNLMRQLEQQLQQGELSQKAQQDIAKQLQQLSQQMKQLAQEKTAMEEALGKMGLDKKMAQMDGESLRKALQEKGFSKMAIEELMNQQAAMQMAHSQMQSLSEAMASCCGGQGGGLSGEDLGNAMNQLDELSAMSEQCKLSDAALEALEQAITAMGQGMGIGGEGAQNPFQAGPPRGAGPGTGGPGQGYGMLDSDSEGEFSTVKTKLKNEGQGGPAIASWYFQGDQAKGESERSIQDVVTSGREQAAEAMEENRIPAKYHDSVKQYFGELDQDSEDP